MQILFDSDQSESQIVDVSDALLSSTVFSTATHYFCPCLTVYTYFLSLSPLLFLYLFVSHFSVTSHLLFFLVAPLSTLVVPSCFSSSSFSSCHVSFILLSLTNIPSTSCSAPVIPPVLNPRTSSAANPFPPDVARYCGCEERCSDSEMCQSAES